VGLRSFQTWQVVVLRAGQLARQAVLDGAPEEAIAQIEAYIATAANKAAEVMQLRQSMAEFDAMKQQAQAQPGPGPMGAPAPAPPAQGPA
jgi:hypothetical protein